MGRCGIRVRDSDRSACQRKGDDDAAHDERTGACTPRGPSHGYIVGQDGHLCRATVQDNVADIAGQRGKNAAREGDVLTCREDAGWQGLVTRTAIAPWRCDQRGW